MKNQGLFLILCFFLAPQMAGAQETMTTGVDFSLKGGPAILFKEDGGIFMGADFSYYENSKIYNLGFKHIEEFSIFGPPDYLTNHLEFMTGKYNRRKFISTHWLIGGGPIWGETYNSNSYTSDNYVGISLFMETGIRLVPAKFMALGLDAELSINGKNPAFMIALNLGFGRPFPR